MNSVVASFSLSYIASIQALMSCMDLSMTAMVSSSDGALLSLLVFLFSCLKVPLIEWSSAKLFRVNESGTISDSVEA